MYRSLGKLSCWVTITARPGAAATAALTSLWRFTEVLSVTTTSPGRAPIRRAILSPTRRGAAYQPAPFQLRTRPLPHSSSTAAATRAGVAAGSAPSELPSR